MDEIEPTLLLPLRMEVRYFHQGEVSSDPDEQFWIRWYPDDIHLPIPVGKISGKIWEKWETYKDKSIIFDWAKAVNQLYQKILNKLKSRISAGLDAEQCIQEGKQHILQCFDEFFKSQESTITVKSNLGEIKTQLIKQVGIEPLLKEMGGILQKLITESEKVNEIENLFNNHRDRNIYEYIRIFFGKDDPFNEFFQKYGSQLRDDFGVIRARQLAKATLLGGPRGSWDFDVANEDLEDPFDLLLRHGMPIQSIPERVSLFCIKDEELEFLRQINVNTSNLLVSVGSVDADSWMTNFSLACRDGMGIKISDPSQVEKIKKADWMIIVGSFGAGNSFKVFEDLLKRRNAVGQLRILPQDSPTNNTETSRGLAGIVPDVGKYFIETNYHVPSPPSQQTNIYDIIKLTDCEILSHIFNLDNATLGEMEGSELHEQCDARAMNTLLWDVCTYQFWYYFFTYLQPLNTGPLFHDQLNSEKKWEKIRAFIKSSDLPKKVGTFFHNNVRGRGNFPILQVGDNPYGILPITHYDTSQGNHQSNASFAFLDIIKREFLKFAKEVPNLGDPSPTGDITEELLRVLGHLPVSCRLNVRFFKDPLCIQFLPGKDNDPCEVASNLVKEEKCTDPVEPDCFKETHYLAVFADLCQYLKNTIQPPKIKVNLYHPNDASETSGKTPSDPNPPAPSSPTLPEKPMLKSALKIPPMPAKVTIADLKLKLVKPATKEPIYLSNFRGKHNPPVLKRLLYYFLEKNTNPDAKQREKPALDLNDIENAAKYLLHVDPTKLEVLLMEFFDLLSYRLDAWVTGSAFEQLIKILEVKNQFAQEKHLKWRMPLGVYGWLEKPGVKTTALDAPEYIQAPSLGQATTAAILRNAALNVGVNSPESPYALNLSSEQVRKGLWYLDSLRQNHGSEELLGYQVERMIHDKVPGLEEGDIYKLRKCYPLEVQVPVDEDRSTGINSGSSYLETVINGELFLDDVNDSKIDWTKWPSRINKKNKRAGFKLVRQAVEQIRDAAADIAVAETSYQFLKGNIEAATAWHDFLDGDANPPEAEFVKSVRTGDRHDTKYYLFIQTSPDFEGIFNKPLTKIPETQYIIPRSFSSPIFSKLCDDALNGFTELNFDIVISRKTPPKTCRISNMTPKNLEMTAIDWVVGGFSEFCQRIYFYALNKVSGIPLEMNLNELLGVFSISNIDEIKSAFEPFEEKARLTKNVICKTISSNREGSTHPSDLKAVLIDDPALMNCEPIINDLLTRADILRWRISYLSSFFSCIKNICSAENLLEQLQALLFGAKNGLPIKSIDSLRGIGTELDENYLQFTNTLAIKGVDTSELDDNFKRLFKLKENIDGVLNIALPAKDFASLIDGITNLDPTSVDYSPTISSVRDFAASVGELFLNYIVEIKENLRVRLREAGNQGYLPAFIPLPEDIIHSVVFNQVLSGLTDVFSKRKDLIVKDIKSILNLPLDQPAPSIDSILQSPVLKSSTGVYVDIKPSYSQLIQIIQDAIGGSQIPVFTPFVLTDDGLSLKDWHLDFNNMIPKKSFKRIDETTKQSTLFGTYARVRRRIDDALKMCEKTGKYEVFAKYFVRPQVNTNETGESHPDIMCIVPPDYQNVKCLVAILVDQFQEFFPNKTETTGIAYHYNAPEVEAPNALLIAIPPLVKSGGSQAKEPRSDSTTPSKGNVKPIIRDTILPTKNGPNITPPVDQGDIPSPSITYLAHCVHDTIDLMKIRMVEPKKVLESNTLGHMLPALKFGPSGIDAQPSTLGPLFPILKSFLLQVEGYAQYAYAMTQQLIDSGLITSTPATNSSTSMLDQPTGDDGNDT